MQECLFNYSKNNRQINLKGFEWKHFVNYLQWLGKVCPWQWWTDGVGVFLLGVGISQGSSTTWGNYWKVTLGSENVVWFILSLKKFNSCIIEVVTV